MNHENYLHCKYDQVFLQIPIHSSRKNDLFMIHIIFYKIYCQSEAWLVSTHNQRIFFIYFTGTINCFYVDQCQCYRIIELYRN